MSIMEVLPVAAEITEEDTDMDLPDEITGVILSRLPVRFLVQCRCVTPTWRALINNPFFIDMHIQHCKRNNSHKLMLTSTYCIYSLRCCDEPDNKVLQISHPKIDVLYDVEIWGSCNGLVCLTHNVTMLCLWNPGTRDYRRVPDLPSRYTQSYCQMRFVYGFGYNRRAEDYVIIQIISHHRHIDDFAHQSSFCVYSLRKNSWGNIQDTSQYVIESQEMGELVNNALHWVGSYYGVKSIPNLIIAYDIAEEKFREVPLPDGYQKDHDSVKIHVATLHGCLSTICKCKHSVEAWVMKDYNVKESWVKVLRIAEYSHDSNLMVNSIPLCFAIKCAKLIDSFNSRTQLFHTIGSPMAADLLDQHSTVTTYVESIVSP